MNHRENTAGPDRLQGALNRVIGGEAACQMTDAGSCRPATIATIATVVDVRADRNFADALMHVRNEKRAARAARAGWNGRGQHIEVQYPDKGSRMSAPYLVLKNVDNQLVPWVPSQGDLFASDWALLP